MAAGERLQRSPNHLFNLSPRSRGPRGGGRRYCLGHSVILQLKPDLDKEHLNAVRAFLEKVVARERHAR